MDISTFQIKSTLDELNIFYNWENNNNHIYTIASLFAPMDNGFYFYTGINKFPFKIKDSLIIVSNKIEATPGNGNVFIYIRDRDIQECYYHILNRLFGRTSNGIIAPTCIISPQAKIGKNVQIDDFCVIEDCVIEDNVIIGSHTKIHSNTVIRMNSILESQCVIGTQGVAWTWNEGQSEKIIQPQLGGVSIGHSSFLGANTIIVRGSLNEMTTIGNNVLMAPGGRIGHGTIIEDYVHFANNVVTGGNTKIGKYSFIGSAAVFRPKVNVHPKTIVGAGSVVVENTSTEGLTVIGVPGKERPTVESPSGMPKPKK